MRIMWSEKVKELMNQKNMNQIQLSEKSGITTASICRYLKGERRPRIDVVVNIAKALDVDVEYLLDDGEKLNTPYECVKMAIARHGNNLTEEEQKELAEMIYSTGKNV